MQIDDRIIQESGETQNLPRMNYDCYLVREWDAKRGINTPAEPFLTWHSEFSDYEIQPEFGRNERIFP